MTKIKTSKLPWSEATRVSNFISECGKTLDRFAKTFTTSNGTPFELDKIIIEMDGETQGRIYLRVFQPLYLPSRDEVRMEVTLVSSPGDISLNSINICFQPTWFEKWARRLADYYITIPATNDPVCDCVQALNKHLQELNEITKQMEQWGYKRVGGHSFARLVKMEDDSKWMLTTHKCTSAVENQYGPAMDAIMMHLDLKDRLLSYSVFDGTRGYQNTILGDFLSGVLQYERQIPFERFDFILSRNEELTKAIMELGDNK